MVRCIDCIHREEYNWCKTYGMEVAVDTERFCYDHDKKEVEVNECK